DARQARSALPRFPVAQRKLCGFSNVSRDPCAAQTNRIAVAGITGETADNSTDCEKCRLYFQEPGQLSGRKTGGRIGSKKFQRWKSARFGSARQFHRERRRRDRDRSFRTDRPNQEDSESEARH